VVGCRIRTYNFFSKASDVKNMPHSGILDVFVPKEGQQSSWKWNVTLGNKKKTTDNVYREKLQRGIKKDFM
jgi:hypothetical protein